jgi:HEAT repeat protein
LFATFGHGGERSHQQSRDRAVTEIAKAYPLKGVSGETRRGAIEVLGKIGSLSAAGVLEKILKTEADEDLRAAIRRALEKIADDP